MNTDIRIAVSFLGHRKRKKLQRKLGAAAVLSLIDLWIVAAMNKPDGVLVGMDAEDIALDSGWDGDANEFVGTLIEIGFIDVEDGCYVLHDWGEHNGYAATANARKDVARKAANARWRKKRGVVEPGNAETAKEQFITDELVMHVDASSNAQACNEHCTSGASAMQRHENSNAPSPSPSPSPSPKRKENTLCDRNTPPRPKARDEPAPSGAEQTKMSAKFYTETFEKFWEAFADKRGRTPAWNAWRKIKGLNHELAERIISGAKIYATQRQAILARNGTPKMAQGWLNDKRWEDESEAVTAAAVPVMNKDLGAAFARVLEGSDGCV